MIERFIVTYTVVIVRIQLYHIGPEYHGCHKHFILMDEKYYYSVVTSLIYFRV